MAVVNGKLTGNQVVALQSAPGQRLRSDAAASWDRLAAAYRARTGRTLNITDSYRPIADQERIFKQRYAAQAVGGGWYGDVRYWNGVRYVRRRGTAAAAIPGTSNHGWGLAVDAGITSFTSAEYRDLAAIAGYYGWNNAAGRNPRVNEPWHWEYVSATDSSAKGAGPGAGTASGTLRKGSVGPAVEALQRGLNKFFPAYSDLRVDGDFGPATEKVVIEFQGRSGLEKDGVVGPATKAALARAGVRL